MALATCALSGGCDGVEEDAAEEPRVIKMQLLQFLTYGPVFIALEEGYFADEGIEIEMVAGRRAPEAVPLLARGELDVMGGSLCVALFNAVARGSNVRVVADRGYLAADGPTWFGVVARDSLTPEALTTMAGQTGRLKIACPTDTPQTLLLDTMLAGYGLSLADVDAQFVPPPALVTTLEHERADIAVIGQPWLTRLLDSEHVKLLHRGEEVIPDMQLGILAFGPSLLEEDSEAGKRFMVANLRGVRRYNEGKTQRNIEILARHTGLDPEFLRRAPWPNMAGDGRLDLESTLAFQGWAHGRGLVDRELTAQEIWDSRFVDYAAHEVGKR
jgi:NitT/TauT family transport system substrate-binding protein